MPQILSFFYILFLWMIILGLKRPLGTHSDWLRTINLMLILTQGDLSLNWLVKRFSDAPLKESVHFVFPSTYPSMRAFSKEPSLHIKCGNLSLVICTLSENCRVICTMLHVFVFLAAHGNFRSLLHTKVQGSSSYPASSTFTSWRVTENTRLVTKCYSEVI